MMPNKSDTNGQPTLEKLEAEGVPIRKCIAMGESYGGNGNQGGGSKAAKSSGGSSRGKGALASVPMRKGGY